MLRHSKTSDIGASRAGQCRVGYDQDARLPRVWRECMTTDRLTRRWIRRRSKFGNQPQNVAEQIPRDGDFGHLEGDIATVGRHLGADLDQLLLYLIQAIFGLGRSAEWRRWIQRGAILTLGTASAIAVVASVVWFTR